MGRTKKEIQAGHVAGLYYEQQLSQQEITKIIGRSLSTVSRLISDAHDMGLVHISIDRPVDFIPDLSNRLRKEFNLREAQVVSQSGSVERDYQSVGIAAADFLTSIIEEGMKIGITWGRTLAEMLRHVSPQKYGNMEIFQISGSLGTGNTEIDGPRLAIKLAELLGSSCNLIPAPAVADSEDLRDAIVAQNQIRSTLERASKVDVIIQGIGSIEAGKSSLERAGYISADELMNARKSGAVGHVFARMIDIEGVEVSDFSKRVIGIPLECMRTAKWSIGISATVEKAPAIFGALRGGYFNTLIVEEASALHLLEMASEMGTEERAAA